MVFCVLELKLPGWANAIIWASHTVIIIKSPVDETVFPLFLLIFPSTFLCYFLLYSSYSSSSSLFFLFAFFFLFSPLRLLPPRSRQSSAVAFDRSIITLLVRSRAISADHIQSAMDRGALASFQQSQSKDLGPISTAQYLLFSHRMP